ncbi:MAG: hypothetical protein ACTS47_01825, partial [Candidatus Hodgkinia cicadicola]
LIRTLGLHETSPYREIFNIHFYIIASTGKIYYKHANILYKQLYKEAKKEKLQLLACTVFKTTAEI